MSEIRGWDYASLTCVEGDSQSNPWNTHFSATWGCLGFLKIPMWIFSASAGLLVEMQMWEPKAKEWVYEEEPTAQARSVLCVDWYCSSWWFVNWPTPISPVWMGFAFVCWKSINAPSSMPSAKRFTFCFPCAKETSKWTKGNVLSASNTHNKNAHVNCLLFLFPDELRNQHTQICLYERARKTAGSSNKKGHAWLR